MTNYSFPSFTSTQVSFLFLFMQHYAHKKNAKIRREKETKALRDKRRIKRFWSMEIKVEAEESRHLHDGEQKLPLLQDAPKSATEEERTLIQKAIRQTFQSTAHLANLLPTGTVLAFQLLAPIFTNLGNCDSVSRSMTAGLVALCGASSFLLSFTDSFRDKNGNVCYGFATFKGLWIIDGSANISPEVAANFRLQFIDFLHAFMSILVFAAVALFDQNVVNCFYPTPSDEAQEVLTALPVGIGVICSMLFVVFPTKRHGIGFPLSAS
ncbi:protein DMP4-like [Malus domestica]|nr:protein DMP4-like [Malus domestica]